MLEKFILSLFIHILDFFLFILNTFNFFLIKYYLERFSTFTFDFKIIFKAFQDNEDFLPMSFLAIRFLLMLFYA